MVVPERMHRRLYALERSYIFVHPETVITVFGMFGGCTVILPAGVVAEVSGLAIFGGRTSVSKRR